MKTYISKNFYYVNQSGKNILINAKTDKRFDTIDLDLEISIYEDQVIGWFLDVADWMTKHPTKAGFPRLQIALSYIEGNQQYREGCSSKNRSPEFFTKGMKRIFAKENLSDQFITDFYDFVRCGLFHDSMTRSGVFVSEDYDSAIKIEGENIFINPSIFVDKIKQDFSNYIAELKKSEDSELRSNFDKWYKERNQSVGDFLHSDGYASTAAIPDTEEDIGRSGIKGQNG